jgi:hypothetical protein
MNKISKNDLAGGMGLPWYSLIVLIIIALMGLFLGQGIGLLLSILFTNLSLDQLPNLVSQPFTADKWMPIYLLQGFGTLGGFIISSIVYLKLFEKIRPLTLFKKIQDPAIFLISIVMVISFMFANSFLIDWNANFNFPNALKDFETWARGKENELKIVTDFLIQFKSPADFFTGFIIIAVLPAIGEEYLFRGIIQNKLELILKNGHVAIWFTAILFSAFHFQFFGFVPRMMLGVLFGYMYLWSRNLWFPVLAHFLNNGFTLTMIYLYNEGIVKMNIEDDKVLPWSTTLVFTLLGVVLLFYFRRYFFQKNIAVLG